MTSPDQLPETEIGQRLKAVMDYIRDCDRRIAKGEIMNLQGLDRTVTELCETIAALPREEALTYEAPMTKLIAGLEEMAENLRSQHKQYAEAGGKR